MKNWILLDSESTVDLFCNECLVTDIKDNSHDPLVLSTNAGSTTIDQVANVPKYGKVHFDKNAMTNIFSLALMEDKHRVTYDSAVESAFIVHTPSGKIKFKRGPQNLYYMEAQYNTGICHVETVAENKKFYTDRQVSRAKRARDLLHSIGCPSVDDLKNLIKMNSIQNNPVTQEDVDMAEKIFGPDVASLKGKTTRKKSIPVVNDVVQIPPELKLKQQNVDLCIDTFYINGLAFFSTIAKRIQYKTAQYVASKTIPSYRSVLEEIFTLYQNAEFKIASIHCDNEFRPVLDNMLQEHEYSFTPNYASAQEHVPEIERSNRTIQERCRAVYHTLPFDLPAIFIKYLVMEQARKLNLFPSKNGISAYYSPREILHQQKVDYAKHCMIPQFSYVQAHDEPKPSNTPAPRTLDCIYLRPLTNQQGGHELYNLKTGRVITRRKVTVVPITQAVIDTVNQLANNDDMQGLIIKSRTGHILYNSISFVDYLDFPIRPHLIF